MPLSHADQEDVERLIAQYVDSERQRLARLLREAAKGLPGATERDVLHKLADDIESPEDE